AALVRKTDHVFGFDELTALCLERFLEDISRIRTGLSGPSVFFMTLESLDAGLPVVVRCDGDDHATDCGDRFTAGRRRHVFATRRTASAAATRGCGEKRAHHH